MHSHSERCIPVCMDGIGKRVEEARRDRGWTPGELARRVGIKYQTIQNLESGKAKGTRFLVSIARELGVTPGWLETGHPPKRDLTTPAPTQGKSGDKLTLPELNIQQWAKDVPIVGSAACGEDGVFELNGEIVDYAKRFPSLVGVESVFALYLDGHSMEPWREHGGLVYVHPGAPIRIGDYVVAELHPESVGGARRAYCKRLLRRTADVIVLAQYNPAEEKRLPAKRVKRLYRILDWPDLLT